MKKIDYLAALYPGAQLSYAPAVEHYTGEELLDLLRNEPEKALAYMRMLARKLEDIHHEVGRINADGDRKGK